jgi:hypothetical protein
MWYLIIRYAKQSEGPSGPFTVVGEGNAVQFQLQVWVSKALTGTVGKLETLRRTHLGDV